MTGVLPHGGGAVAAVIFGLAAAVIAATVALEKNRTTRATFGWALTAFVVAFVIGSAVADLRD
jgi:NAD/NADP transhydrogenase beta subunit